MKKTPQFCDAVQGLRLTPHVIDDTTSLYNAQSRGTAQIDDVSTWLPPSLDSPWQNVFFEYINKFKIRASVFKVGQKKLLFRC